MSDSASIIATMETQFSSLEQIGKGSFGDVFKGFDKERNKDVAIKVIDLEEAEDDIDDIQKEISVLSQCRSPYITDYYGSYLHNTKIWIVMEYMAGGSVADLLQTGPPLDEMSIASILRDLLNAVEYLHSEGKIHRDIKAANILLTESGDVKVADFGVSAQLTKTISRRKVGDDVTILDATGKYVMPGGIDPHTHLAMDFMGTQTIDDFFTGQAAALAGGTTMHIDFVIPVDGSLSAGFDSYVDKAKKSAMDYGFHMAVTKWDETVSKDMEIMVKEKGINSFKFFMAYKGSLMINDDLLLQAFEKCKSLGALAMVHAENGDGVAKGQEKMIDLGITGPEGHALSRPPVLEGEATARAIRLASFVNTPLYVVHVMSIDAMEEIARAKTSGQRVVGEPVVSGLILDDSWLWSTDFKTAAKYVMSPPIRKAGHNKALQAALSTGVLQLVGTDHCAFNSSQKALGVDDFRKIPNGVNGIEERMHLIWDTMVESGQISITDYVRVTSTECARIFNIYPRKGAILEGSDADLIILNPNASFKISAAAHHSRSDTNVYEGRTGKGKVEVTISGGRIVWQEGRLNVVPGSGRYIEMPPYGHLFDGIDKADAEYIASLRAPVQRIKDVTYAST